MLNIDNLTYGYTAGSNRLATVTDATANAQGFNPMGGSGYNYDLNDDRMVPIENWKWSATKALHNEGNATNRIASTTNNSYKQITDTKYYFNNLPKDITVNQGVSNVNKIRFTYDASGRKLRKQVFNNSNVSTYLQDYFGKIEYVNNAVEAIYHPEGRAVWNGTSWRYEFNITDHLGNIRAVISDINDNKIINISTNQATNEIINVNSYYPFGLVMGGTFSNNTTTIDTRYQYNSKEMNSDLGLNLLDYGARWYDATVGRFTSVDPLGEKYISISPYAYVANNPIKYIDPTGAYIVDQDGNRVEMNKDKEGKISFKGNLNESTAKILNAMITTDSGLESAANLISMADEVQLEITTDKLFNVQGEEVHGKTTKEESEKGEFSHYKIVISTADLGDRMDGFSEEEKLNIIGVHEEFHILGDGDLLENEIEPVSKELQSRFEYSKK